MWLKIIGGEGKGWANFEEKNIFYGFPYIVSLIVKWAIYSIYYQHETKAHYKL